MKTVYAVTGVGADDVTFEWSVPVYDGDYNAAGVDPHLFVKAIMRAAADELERQGLDKVEVTVSAEARTRIIRP